MHKQNHWVGNSKKKKNMAWSKLDTEKQNHASSSNRGRMP